MRKLIFVLSLVLMLIFALSPQPARGDWCPSATDYSTCTERAECNFNDCMTPFAGYIVDARYCWEQRKADLMDCSDWFAPM